MCKFFRRLGELSFTTLVCQPGALSAQLSAPNDRGVAMGHMHYNVRDEEKQGADSG